MKFLIQFPDFINIDNSIRLRSGVIDTIVPSQIIDDRIIALISQPISIDSFEEHINDLLPVFAFSCGFGRVKIFSECKGIVFELKRSCRISRLPQGLPRRASSFRRPSCISTHSPWTAGGGNLHLR